MGLLPAGTGAILGRELGALARRRLLVWGRVAALLGLLAVVVVSWIESFFRGRVYSSMALASFGRELLAWTFGSLAALLLLLMPAVMGGLIAEEREKGRLDLLRMTPLGAVQIVLEKFLSRLAFAFQWVALGGPFFLIPLFFGGVTAEGVLVAVLFPVGAAVWVASLALLLSSLGRRPVAAMLLAYFISGVYLFSGWILLGYGIGLGDGWFYHAFPLTAYFVVPAPEIIWMPAGAGPTLSLLWQLPLETLAFAMFCVLAAAWRLRREEGGREAASARAAIGAARRQVWDRAVAWKETVMGAGSGARRVMAAALALYATGLLFPLAGMVRQMARRAGPDRADQLWNATYLVGAAGVLIGVLGLAGAAVPRRRRFFWGLAAAYALLAAFPLVFFLGSDETIGWIARFIRMGSDETIGWNARFTQAVYFREQCRDILLAASLVLCAGLAVAAAVVSAFAVAGERAGGTLETLRITPLSARAILDGKAIGCLWTLGPGLVLLALQVAVLAAAYGFRIVGAAFLLMTLLGWLWATVELGLWISARSRGPVRAALLMAGVLGACGILDWGMLLFSRLFGLLGIYVNPAFWTAMAAAWGGASETDKVARLAPLWAFPIAWAVWIGLALFFRRAAAKAFETRR